MDSSFFGKKTKKMMNAIGMFIVTEILQAWILSMCIDANYYDNLNYREKNATLSLPSCFSGGSLPAF